MATASSTVDTAAATAADTAADMGAVMAAVMAVITTDVAAVMVVTMDAMTDTVMAVNVEMATVEITTDADTAATATDIRATHHWVGVVRGVVRSKHRHSWERYITGDISVFNSYVV